MLFEAQLFEAPLFEGDAPSTPAPSQVFTVTRQDSGTPYSFTAQLKDPDSVEFHGMDWSGWLQDTDIIATIALFAEPAGLSIDREAHADGIVTWQVQGGAVDADYIITCRVTTASGLVDDRSVRVPVRQR